MKVVVWIVRFWCRKNFFVGQGWKFSHLWRICHTVSVCGEKVFRLISLCINPREFWRSLMGFVKCGWGKLSSMNFKRLLALRFGLILSSGRNCGFYSHIVETLVFSSSSFILALLCNYLTNYYARAGRPRADVVEFCRNGGIRHLSGRPLSLVLLCKGIIVVFVWTFFESAGLMTLVRRFRKL